MSVLPCLFVPGSRRVAIVDSGVLLGHPLLAGAIADVREVTGGTALGMDDAQGLGLPPAGQGGVRVIAGDRRDEQWGSVPRVRGGRAVVAAGGLDGDRAHGTATFQATLP